VVRPGDFNEWSASNRRTPIENHRPSTGRRPCRHTTAFWLRRTRWCIVRCQKNSVLADALIPNRGEKRISVASPGGRIESEGLEFQPGQFVNQSARSWIGPGDDVQIAGFVVAGAGRKTVGRPTGGRPTGSGRCLLIRGLR
jgi:hypothetical protein